MRSILLFLTLLPGLAAAQSSTFNTSNEFWTTNGDPSNSTPGWVNTGGNPGGYIRGVDAVQGGIWYFVAPPKFLGNKCEAYGKFIRWDQTRNDTTNTLSPGGAPDLLLKGGGYTLAWDNPQHPGLTWTHYDVPLNESAGWHLDDNNGPAPTQAEFQTVLSNLYSVQIRGEYRYGGDFGGLDNFILENNFNFDLDGDDSSGATDGNFLADTSCMPLSALVGADVLISTGKRIDSIVVTLQFPQNPGMEILEILSTIPNIGVAAPQTGALTLYNTGNATGADFLSALQALQYRDNSPAPPRGVRIVAARLYTECGDMGVRYAYLAIFPPVDAGPDAALALCSYDAPANLSTLLGGETPPEAYWSPALPGGIFNPGADASGRYAYIIPDAGGCPGDTAEIALNVEQPFHLRADTTLCFGDTLLLTAPPGWDAYAWNTGSPQSTLAVTEEGLYILEAQSALCTFSDSVHIGFYQCVPCPWYAPNVFMPNDDGVNDRWQLFFSCPPARFQLEIFDRWGTLVYRTDDYSQGWDGFAGTREAPAGVYIWRASWETGLFGQTGKEEQGGSVGLVR